MLLCDVQVQHIVAVPDPDPLSEPDPMDPVVPRLKKLLTGLDVDGDGVASRKDVLLAFRRDRQLADHLRMTPKVKVSAVSSNALGCTTAWCTLKLC